MTDQSPATVNRLAALRRFAVAITVFNVLGHTVLGFEQSWAQPLTGVATAYSMEILLEWISSIARRRPPRFAGGFKALVNFLLPAHITGLAVSMLLYPNDRLAPIAFAAGAAIASKTVFRLPARTGGRHFFNPSNFGITLALLLLPWIGLVAPYHFTENLSGIGDWVLPLIIIVSGSVLNARYTHRIILLSSWLVAFVAQALVRHWLFGAPVGASLLPMTGVAFILFTFYMVTDPATTPDNLRAQAVFGVSVASVYGLLMSFHVVFGLFIALTVVCAGRGCAIYAAELRRIMLTEPRKSTVLVDGRAIPATTKAESPLRVYR